MEASDFQRVDPSSVTNLRLVGSPGILDLGPHDVSARALQGGEERLLVLLCLAASSAQCLSVQFRPMSSERLD